MDSWSMMFFVEAPNRSALRARPFCSVRVFTSCADTVGLLSLRQMATWMWLTRLQMSPSCFSRSGINSYLILADALVACEDSGCNVG